MLQICQEMTGYNANLDLVNINAYTIFVKIYQLVLNIEQKRNSEVSQWPYLRLFKYQRKMTSINSCIEHVNIDAYTNLRFYRLVLKTLSGNENLTTSNKGHFSVTN